MILFHYPDTQSGRNWWAFDHMNDHSNLAAGIADSSSLTGAIRYLLDPIQGLGVANGNWNQWHQQAHDDAAVYYGVAPSLPNRLGQGSQDFEWWLFTNSWEHVALDAALLNQG